MEKKLIKYSIKKSKFVEDKPITTNPCLEIYLPDSYEPITLWTTPNWGGLLEYSNGYGTGELSVILGDILEERNRYRRRRTTGDYLYDSNGGIGWGYYNDGEL